MEHLLCLLASLTPVLHAGCLAARQVANNQQQLALHGHLIPSLLLTGGGPPGASGRGSSLPQSPHLLPLLMSPPLSVHLQAAFLPAEDPARLQPAPGSSLPRLPLDRLVRTGRDGAAPHSPLDMSAIRSGHAELPASQRSHRATPMVLTGGRSCGILLTHGCAKGRHAACTMQGCSELLQRRLCCTSLSAPEVDHGQLVRGARRCVAEHAERFAVAASRLHCGRLVHTLSSLLAGQSMALARCHPRHAGGQEGILQHACCLGITWHTPAGCSISMEFRPSGSLCIAAIASMLPGKHMWSCWSGSALVVPPTWRS